MDNYFIFIIRIWIGIGIWIRIGIVIFRFRIFSVLLWLSLTSPSLLIILGISLCLCRRGQFCNIRIIQNRGLFNIAWHYNCVNVFLFSKITQIWIAKRNFKAIINYGCTIISRNITIHRKCITIRWTCICACSWYSICRKNWCTKLPCQITIIFTLFFCTCARVHLSWPRILITTTDWRWNAITAVWVIGASLGWWVF